LADRREADEQQRATDESGDDDDQSDVPSYSRSASCRVADDAEAARATLSACGSTQVSGSIRSATAAAAAAAAAPGNPTIDSIEESGIAAGTSESAEAAAGTAAAATAAGSIAGSTATGAGELVATAREADLEPEIRDDRESESGPRRDRKRRAETDGSAQRRRDDDGDRQLVAVPQSRGWRTSADERFRAPGVPNSRKHAESYRERAKRAPPPTREHGPQSVALFLGRPSPGDASFTLPAAEPAKGYRGGSVSRIDNAVVVRWWESGSFPAPEVAEKASAGRNRPLGAWRHSSS